MIKKIILWVAIAATVAAVGYRFVATAPGGVEKQSVVLKGKIICLPHKNTSGSQTMECAFGLEDEQGNKYGLRDIDPEYKNLAGAVFGEQVVIKGTLNLASDPKYDSRGVVEVVSVETLRSTDLKAALKECLPKSDVGSKDRCTKLLKQVSDFDACVELGFAVQESYPRRCLLPDGRSFSETI